MEKRVWHQFYDQGVPASIDFEDVSVPAFLERSAAKHGDANALIFVNRRLTYRQLREEVDRFATALAALGVEKDTKVAIQLPNLPQTVIGYYATLSLGAQAVMTNSLYVEREIEHQWDDAGCALAVVADFLFERRMQGHPQVGLTRSSHPVGCPFVPEAGTTVVRSRSKIRFRARVNTTCSLFRSPTILRMYAVR